MNHKYTLKKNHEIEKLVHLHKSVGSKNYAVYYEDSTDTKIVISISKKLGKAHYRNYQKRVVKEIVRNNLYSFKEKKALIVIKANSCNLNYKEKENELKRLFNKMKGKNNEK